MKTWTWIRLSRRVDRIRDWIVDRGVGERTYNILSSVSSWIHWKGERQVACMEEDMENQYWYRVDIPRIQLMKGPFHAPIQPVEVIGVSEKTVTVLDNEKSTVQAKRSKRFAYCQTASEARQIVLDEIQTIRDGHNRTGRKHLKESIRLEGLRKEVEEYLTCESIDELN